MALFSGPVFSSIAHICLIISILILLFRFGKRQAPMRVFFLFLVLNLVIEYYANILFAQKQNNLFLLHYYTFGEFLLLSIFYYFLLPFSQNSKKYYRLFVGTASAFIILNSVFIQDLSGYNSYAKTLVQASVVGYTLLYFYKFINSDVEMTYKDSSYKLINSGILLYYAGSLFIFMFTGILQKTGLGMPRVFWIFNSALYFIFQLIVLIAVWKQAFSKTKSISSLP